MTSVFADTSALYPLLSRTDENHEPAARAFSTLRARDARLVATSYVLVETYALVGRRLGPQAAHAFRSDVAPLLDVMWVDETLHEAGLDILVAQHRRQLSLVDAVSFAAMRQRGLLEVFTFDRHFADEGFAPVR